MYFTLPKTANLISILIAFMLSVSAMGQTISNDESCTGIPIFCGDSIPQSFAGATQSMEDECSGSATGDVWFTFTSDGSQRMTIGHTTMSDFKVVSQLFSGQACDDIGEEEACSLIGNYVVTQPGTYYYRIRPSTDYYNDHVATVFLSCSDFECPDLPAMIGSACDDGNPETSHDNVTADCECAGVPDATNDEACTATAIACGDTLLQSFVGATDSEVGDCSSFGLGDVWFSFTTDGAQMYTIGVGNGSEFGESNQLYIGDDCENLTPVSECYYAEFHVYAAGTYYYRLRPASSSYEDRIAEVYLTCVDYDCTDLSLMEGDACDDGNPNTTFDSVNAECECVGIPDAINDGACTATEIACGDTILQSFAGATQSVIDNCGGSNVNDVWFRFTTEGTALYTIGESDNDFNAVIQLYEGDDCEILTEVTECVYFDHYFEVTEAGTYYFRIRPRNSLAIASVYLTCEPYDCADLKTFVGRPCNDDDTTTTHDIITDDCACAGVPDAINDEACTATNLACGDTLLQSFVDATQSYEDDCSINFNQSVKDVWFTFTIADAQPHYIGGLGYVNGTFTEFQYEGSGLIMEILKGEDCNSLTEVVPCHDNYGLTGITLNDPGTYYLRIRPAIDYADDQIAAVVMQCGNPVGVSEIENSGFRVYPNPARDYMTIEMNSEYLAQPSKAYLYTSLGRKVATYSLSENVRQVLSLPNTLAQGIYFLKLNTDYGGVTKKIVVLR